MLETGELLWQFKRKHAGDIILNDERLVCFFYDWGAASISISDGTLINRYSLTTPYEGRSMVADESHMLIWPKRNNSIVLDMDAKEVYRISLSILNPQEYHFFFIQQVEMHNGVLTIMGEEGSNDRKLDPYTRSFSLDEFSV